MFLKIKIVDIHNKFKVQLNSYINIIQATRSKLFPN